MKTAVYIKSDRIQAAQGFAGDGRLTVKSFCEQPLGEAAMINGIITDETAAKAALKSMWKRYSLPEKNITLVVDGRGLNQKLLEVPALKGEKMISCIRQEFSETENQDKMLCDWATLGRNPDTGGLTVLACMAEPDFVRSYADLFSSVGIKLSSMDTALNCRIKLIGMLGELKEKTFILSQAEANTVSMTLFVNGMYRFSGRTRITAERDTKAFSEETANLVSSMIQFNKAANTGHDITDLFIGGFSHGEQALLRESAAALGLPAQLLSGGRTVNFEKTGSYETDISDKTEILGGLI